MSGTARRRLTLAASLLLGGCYVGFDDEVERGASTGSEVSATADASATSGVVDPTGSGEPTASETSSTSEASSDPGATEADSGASSGGLEGTTTGDEATATTATMTTGPDPTTATTTTTSGDESSGGADSGMMPAPLDVPDTAHCADVADWAPAWAQLELDVLVIVNQVRSQGANCGTKGAFGPAGPLTMDPALRCAARKHSADMAARNFFDHTNPDGQAPWDRMSAAGYMWSKAGENIAAGSPDAQGTMSQWMGSDGHCANIMSPDFKDIGVGYSTGGQYGHLWTQVFGAK